MKPVAKKLCDIVRERNLSTLELQHMTGIERSQFYKWMSGRTLPSLENAVKVCRALGITLEELVEGME